MSLRQDGSFAVATSSFNPFGEQSQVSYDFNLASQFSQPSFRSKPKISFIRPPADLPFDGTSMNGLLFGALVTGALLLVVLGFIPSLSKR
jgi:hypothetical protein